MASRSNSAIARKQWLVFGAVIAVLAAVALGSAVFFENSTAKKTAAVDKPKTAPLSVGVTESDRAAADSKATGDVQALRKMFNDQARDNETRQKGLEEQLKVLNAAKLEAEKKAATAPAPGNPGNPAKPVPREPGAPDGGFANSNPFSQNGGAPGQPIPRQVGALGASPGGLKSGAPTSLLESVDVGAQQKSSKTGNPLVDGAADGLANSAQDFGKREDAKRSGRDGDRFTRTADDDALAPNRGGGRDVSTYIPAGTYIRAVVLNGMDAPTGGSAQQNPHPVLLQLADDAVLPNKFRAALKNCMVTANGFGDIAAERAYIRTDRLSCIDEEGGAVDVALKGYVAGEDGKTGMRGRIVEKTGRILANALYAAVGSGIGQAFKSQGTSQTTNALGTTTEQVTDGFKAGFGGGVSKAFDRITDYYIKVAEKMFPVIEVGSGRVVDIVVSRGVSIERGSKTKTATANSND